MYTAISIYNKLFTKQDHAVQSSFKVIANVLKHNISDMKKTPTRWL